MQGLMRRMVLAVLVILPVAFLSLFFLWPLLRMFGLGLWGAELVGNGSQTAQDIPWWDMLTRPRTWRVLVDTLVLALAGTVGSVMLGVAGAWVLYGLRWPGRRVLRAFMAVPFVLPSVVVGVAFQNLFYEGGALGFLGWSDTAAGTRLVIVLGMMFFNFALVSRLVGQAWLRLDPRPIWAARALGAGPTRAFLTVTLPRLTPAIAAAASLVFLYCLTSYGLVRVLGGVSVTTLEVEIYLETATYLNLPGAAALSLLQLALVLVALIGNGIARSRYEQARQIRSWVVRSVRHEDIAALFLTGTGLLLVAAPLLALLWRSLRREGEWTGANFLALLQPGLVPGLSGTVMHTVLYSLQIALLSTAISLACGLAVTVVVSRRVAYDSPWRSAQELFDLLFSSPQGISAVTVGFGILITLQAPPFAWSANAWFLAAAQSIVAVPLVLRSILPTLRAVDPRQLAAAASLGATPWRVFSTIEWPLLQRMAAVGAGFAFAISLGEFGATSFLARPLEPTLPLAIYALAARPSLAAQGTAAAAAVLLALLCALAMGLAEWYASQEQSK